MQRAACERPLQLVASALTLPPVHGMLQVRASQEMGIRNMLSKIEETEQFFIKGGDITLKIHELKAMAEDICEGEEHAGEGDNKHGGDMPRGSVPSKDSSGGPRGSTTDARKARQST